jgi:two-component system chemotaxis response regulator CheY
VLIVEDSPTMRALLNSALEGLEPGVKITEASSGFEALRCLPREAFDLIVTDINMPDINGLELVSFMRRTPQHQKTPLIVISTEASVREKDRALALGADAFVSKPFGPEELGAEVERLVRKDEG